VKPLNAEREESGCGKWMRVGVGDGEGSVRPERSSLKEGAHSKFFGLASLLIDVDR
jgi:hypothetical protein